MKKVGQLELVNHLKSTGFVFQNSEIYNGLANAWDFGPLGSILKNNLKTLWRRHFVISQPNMYEIDSGIILNSQVWKASGHLSNFSDPLIDCKACKNRFRADKLIENFDPTIEVTENTSFEEIEKIINDNKISCPNCKKIDWTHVRNFNLMFKTFQGVTEDSLSTLFLRPETAQGIFINFANIQRTMRAKLPFGVGQIGKSFRNEITPGNFIFRVREFEQMEIEYFTTKEDAPIAFENFLKQIEHFLVSTIGINKDNIKQVEHKEEELSHYSDRTIDFQFNFPHGWSELWGLANRTNFDLNNHMKLSKANLSYLDPKTNEKFVPFVIEPSVGVERLVYAILANAYKVEQLENDSRIVLKLKYDLCPYKACFLPLTNKLSGQTKKIYCSVSNGNILMTYDESGSIGKRYRRQDAIGTMFCITVDFDTEKTNEVTIRHRDTMKQERIKIIEIEKYISSYKD